MALWLHKIKKHLVYTVWEISDLLGCHKQTVIRWIKTGGLAADVSRKPWLIDGPDLKTFLGVRQLKARCKLAPHHCYCFGCKGPREPDGKFAEYIQQTADSGRLTALCPECGSLMNKVVRRTDLAAISSKIEGAIQKAAPRLVSCTDPPSKVTFAQEAKTHGKAQHR